MIPPVKKRRRWDTGIVGVYSVSNMHLQELFEDCGRLVVLPGLKKAAFDAAQYIIVNVHPLQGSYFVFSV